jgi:hypothetical protein
MTDAADTAFYGIEMNLVAISLWLSLRAIFIH